MVERRTRDRLSLNDAQLNKLSSVLYSKFKKEERTAKYAPVKEVLCMLGKGALLVTAFLAPNAGKGMISLLYSQKEWDDWKRFNPYYLRRAIASLRKMKQVEVIRVDGRDFVKITKNGKQRILRYALEGIEISRPGVWDGVWRVVMYDIPTSFKNRQEHLRRSLVRLKFYRVQKSVYIYPYECYEEIEYVRAVLGLEKYVRLMEVRKIEHDSAFRIYFGLS